MKNISVIRKISERGQVTLPKKIRHSKAFAGVSAVEFTEHAGTIVVLPVRQRVLSLQNEHSVLLDRTLSDWADPINDDLFDFA